MRNVILQKEGKAGKFCFLRDWETLALLGPCVAAASWVAAVGLSGAIDTPLSHLLIKINSFATGEAEVTFGTHPRAVGAVAVPIL